MEGHVLWTLDREHGLTTADLLTIPMVVLAAHRLRRSHEVRRWLAARSAAPASPRVAPHRVALTRVARSRVALTRVARARLTPARLGGRRVAGGPRSAALLSDRAATGAMNHGVSAPHGLAGGRAGRLTGGQHGAGASSSPLRRLSVSASSALPRSSRRRHGPIVATGAEAGGRPPVHRVGHRSPGGATRLVACASS